MLDKASKPVILALRGCGGIYNGAISEDYVRRRIEEADCVLSIGALMTDFNTGKFSAKLDPSRTIEVHGQYLKIKRALYNNVAMRDLLPREQTVEAPRCRNAGAKTRAGEFGCWLYDSLPTQKRCGDYAAAFLVQTGS